MTQTDKQHVAAGALAGLVTGLLIGMVATHYHDTGVRRKPGAADSGTTYTVNGTWTLTPQGVTPTPTPEPTPTPIPNPTPTPNPTPAPDMAIYDYRDGQRNPASSFLPGTTVWIEGAGFGDSPGSVYVSHVKVPTQSWKSTEIEIVCPAPVMGQAGQQAGLDVVRSTGGSVSNMGFVIIGPPGKAQGKKR